MIDPVLRGGLRLYWRSRYPEAKIEIMPLQVLIVAVAVFVGVQNLPGTTYMRTPHNEPLSPEESGAVTGSEASEDGAFQEARETLVRPRSMMLSDPILHAVHNGRCEERSDSGVDVEASGIYVRGDGSWRETNGLEGLQRKPSRCGGIRVPGDERLAAVPEVVERSSDDPREPVGDFPDPSGPPEPRASVASVAEVEVDTPQEGGTLLVAP